MITRERWGILLGEMIEMREAAGRVAPRVRPMPLPGVGASAQEIADAESRLGFALDAQHAALLREGNGWPDVFGMGDLLSTADLGSGPLWSTANETLDIFYEDGPFETFPPRGEVYPIHASNQDVFVIWRGGPVVEHGHPVYWLGGEVVDQWPNVFEFCLATVRLNEVSIEHALRRR